MATTAAVARNLLKNSRSFPQILRGQILGRSNVNPNLNNVAKDHQIVQSLFVSNQKIHAQVPIFDFPEMGSLLWSSGRLSLAEKGVGHGMGGIVFEARGKGVAEDDDSDEEFDDGGDEFDDEFDVEFVDEDDDDDDDDDEGDDDVMSDGGKYKNKL